MVGLLLFLMMSGKVLLVADLDRFWRVGQVVPALCPNRQHSTTFAASDSRLAARAEPRAFPCAGRDLKGYSKFLRAKGEIPKVFPKIGY